MAAAGGGAVLIVGDSLKQGTEKAAASAVRRCKFRIESGEVFDTLLVFMTRDMPMILDELFEKPDPEEEAAAKTKPAQWRPQRNENWAAMAKSVSEYCRNLLTLLEAVTEGEMASWVLKAVSSTMIYFVATPSLPRKLLKIAITLWSTGEEAVRVRAYVVIRSLVELLPKKLLPMVMKGMYLTYIKHAKVSNPKSLPRINFFVACIAGEHRLHCHAAAPLVVLTPPRSAQRQAGCWRSMMTVQPPLPIRRRVRFERPIGLRDVVPLHPAAGRKASLARPCTAAPSRRRAQPAGVMMW